MSTDEDNENRNAQPWRQIKLTDAIPEDASASACNLDEPPTGFFFGGWRLIRNPKELFRLVDRYSLELDEVAASVMSGDDDGRITKCFGWGEKGPRAAIVSVRSGQFRILEGQPFWGGAIEEPEPGLEYGETRMSLDAGFVDLLLEELQDRGVSEATEPLHLTLETGGDACRA